jgi:hypothetical protein
VSYLKRIASKSGYMFTEPAIEKCCKAFQQANCGKFQVVGSQFAWTYRSADIGKEVIKQLESL